MSIPVLAPQTLNLQICSFPSSVLLERNSFLFQREGERVDPVGCPTTAKIRAIMSPSDNQPIPNLGSVPLKPGSIPTPLANSGESTPQIRPTSSLGNNRAKSPAYMTF